MRHCFLLSLIVGSAWVERSSCGQSGTRDSDGGKVVFLGSWLWGAR